MYVSPVTNTELFMPRKCIALLGLGPDEGTGSAASVEYIGDIQGEARTVPVTETIEMA